MFWSSSFFGISVDGARECTFEPPHDKTSKMTVRPAKTQISLGISPVWSESSLSTWRKLGFLATHWAHNEDWSDWVNAQADLSDQTGWMPRLIWVFAGCTVILLVLSWGGLFELLTVMILSFWTHSHSVCIFWTLYPSVEPLCSNFRTTTAIFLGV